MKMSLRGLLKDSFSFLLPAFSVFMLNASAKQMVCEKVNIYFPSSFSSAVQVQKVFDTKTGEAGIISNVAQIKTVDDLEHFRQIEIDVEKAKHGAMLPDLGNMVDTIDDNEEVDVQIVMRQPRFTYLDKTKHSLEELKANSLAASMLQPIKTTGSLLGQYFLRPSTISNQDDNVIKCKLKNKDLKKIAFDNGVAQISQYFEPKPCAFTPFSNFATSAFNPPPMLGYGQGAGVNAATFENGVWSYLVGCRNLVSSHIDTIPDTSYGDRYLHSNCTFTCLANATPSASLWHHIKTYYGSYPAAAGYTWIIDRNIQTVSCSMAGPTDRNNAECVSMDDMAYRYPWPVFCTPSNNDGPPNVVNWACYNAISVGNVQHLNQSHYQMNGCTQYTNPPPEYGPVIDQTTGAGDREMPYVVAPGIAPDNNNETDNCMDYVLSSDGQPAYIPPSCGSSFSAPVVNGIAADVISADTSHSMLFMFKYWPEATRMAIMLTAQNVDGNYWNCNVDGRDGCGVVSGYNAADYVRNHTNVFPNNSAKQIGMGTGTKYPGDYSVIQYNIAIPSSSLTLGKHLRVVLTWDSNPDTLYNINWLSDLDLSVVDQNHNSLGGSNSWDGNVEVVDILRSNLTPNTTCQACINTYSIRIPSGARAQFFCYAIGWTWVKNYAD